MTEFVSDTSTNRWKVSDVFTRFSRCDLVRRLSEQTARVAAGNEGYESHRVTREEWNAVPVARTCFSDVRKATPRDASRTK